MELDEDKLKKSFTKVKEDIEALKIQINELKSLIENISKKDNFSKFSQKEDNKVPNAPDEVSSTGNEGVYADIHSFIHSFNRHSTDIQQTNIHSTPPFSQQNSPQNNIPWDLSNIKQIDSLFSSLTKQEFFTFMIIYQLEEDIKRGVSYLELSRNMSLSEGCIRTYVSQMLKKSIPLQKVRLNNKLTLLTINKEFRSLGLKYRLSSLFSKTDPNQTTLS